MIIGIDIDDTLNNEYQFMIDYGTKYCYEKNIGELVKIDTIHSTEMFGWSEKTAHQFWHAHMELFNSFPAIPFAGEIISKLKKDGHKIYIITAREHGDEWFPKSIADNMETFTANWLLNNGIPFDKIFFAADDKGKVCKENGVDIMIDDDPYNLDKIIGKAEAFIFDKPYNRDAKYNIATRVYSWFDAYNKIKEFEAKNNGQKI